MKVQLSPQCWAEITGEGKVAHRAQSELFQANQPTGSQILSLEITDKAPPVLPSATGFGAVKSDGNSIQWHFKKMDYTVSLNAAGDFLQATFHVGQRGPFLKIPPFAFPYLERTAMSWHDAQAYHVVLLLEFLALMTGKVGVLHASAVAYGDRALAITSAGGVGKTTSACRLVSDGADYVADDILLIDSNGGMIPSLRKVMVYPYNIAHLPRLEEFVTANSTLRSKLLWSADKHLHLGRRRRRVAPSKLFDGRVAQTSYLKNVVLLRRSTSPGVTVSDITAHSLTYRAAQFVRLEFATFMEMSRITAALLGEKSRWAPEVMMGSLELNLEQAIQRCDRTAIVDVGEGADATDVLRKISLP